MCALRHDIRAETRTRQVLFGTLPGGVEQGELESREPAAAQVGHRELGAGELCRPGEPGERARLGDHRHAREEV